LQRVRIWSNKIGGEYNYKYDKNDGDIDGYVGDENGDNDEGAAKDPAH